MSSEIAEVEQEIQPYNGESWDTLNDQADVVSGSDQVAGDALIGVPFIIVEITLREGDFPHGRFKNDKLIPETGCGKKHPYAYLTAVVADEAELTRAVKRGRLKDDALAVDPGEVLGFIEAGTGVYRQIIKYLHAQAYLTIPEGPDDGAFGETRWDTLPESWDFLRGEVKFDPDGQPVWTAALRFKFPRGLRVSEYSNEYTKEGRTRYAG
jgi:hypothetical protein